MSNPLWSGKNGTTPRNPKSKCRNSKRNPMKGGGAYRRLREGISFFALGTLSIWPVCAGFPAQNSLRMNSGCTQDPLRNTRRRVVYAPTSFERGAGRIELAWNHESYELHEWNAAATDETRKQRGQPSVFRPCSIRGSLVFFIFGSPHFSVLRREQRLRNVQRLRHFLVCAAHRHCRCKSLLTKGLRPQF